MKLHTQAAFFLATLAIFAAHASAAPRVTCNIRYLSHLDLPEKPVISTNGTASKVSAGGKLVLNTLSFDTEASARAKHIEATFDYGRDGLTVFTNVYVSQRDDGYFGMARVCVHQNDTANTQNCAVAQINKTAAEFKAGEYKTADLSVGQFTDQSLDSDFVSHNYRFDCAPAKSDK